mmetsp:Transcript_105965/g.300039  ORF Transcript_105965/g.300039 Transcript_105965/m.300039 type:complete len:1364 (+) Transcript_105965:2-4093(+)
MAVLAPKATSSPQRGGPAGAASRFRAARFFHSALLLSLAAALWAIPAALVGSGRPPTRGQRPWRTTVAQEMRTVARPEAKSTLAHFTESRADRFQKLLPREHVLKRPDMYIGPVQPRDEMSWVLKGRSDQRRLEQATLQISPGFVQIFNEILVNAADRQFSTSGERMSTIRVDVDAKEGDITIFCDGGPIPVEKKESGIWVPTLVFSEFMSGDNFDDSKQRFIGGRNGIGAKATNAFSDLFEVEVFDPTTGYHFKQRWERNMEIERDPEILPLQPDAPGNGGVQVRFRPDLKRFGLRRITKDHMQILESRVFDIAACVRPGIDIFYNGERIAARSFKDYAMHVLGEDVAVVTIKDASGTPRAEIAAAFAGDDGFAAIGIVNAIRCSQGTHERLVTKQLSEGIAEMAPGKRKPRPNEVKRFLRLVVKVLVDSPDFDSQTKTRLTTTPSSMGFELKLPEHFIKEVADLGVLEASVGASRLKQGTEHLKTLSNGVKQSHAKLDDARNAGRAGKNCTLIVTEGDSAKALAVAGLSTWGRDDYGIFPIRGKLLNVRTASPKQLEGNHEIKSLAQIIGLEWGREYQDSEELMTSLRYQHVMIFSDQDLDGDHIAGLLINFVQAMWPSLLRIRPDFFLRFATPILKVFKKSANSDVPAHATFLSEGEFGLWQQKHPDWRKSFRVKYYKGLGTSTRKEAIQYFSDQKKHLITFRRDGEEDDRSVALAFGADESDARKDWIEKGLHAEELDYSTHSASYSDFINTQLVKFSAYNCERSIPLLMDGLKPSQRKVMHVARKMSGEIRVSQLVGKVIEQTAYHHGEASLEHTIVHLAQNFVFTNNVNLLEPSGMFGARLAGRDVHASARYIHTRASALAPFLFRKEDDGILTPRIVDGSEVEPIELLPVLPLILVNGAQGIGTGWSTDCPRYDALEVADALERLILGERVPRLLPAYRGFKGRIEADQDGKLFSYGVWQLRSSRGEKRPPDTLEIHELPVGVWTDDFISALESKADKHSLMIEIYKCRDHDDQNVHLLIGFSADELLPIVFKGSADADQQVATFFGLRRSILRSMWLFHRSPEDGEDAKPSIRYFDGPEEVLTAFYRARREHYARRKKLLWAKLSHEAALKRNQVRFIREYDPSELRQGGKSPEELLAQAGFSRLAPRPPVGFEPAPDADFDYLLGLSFHHLSPERADKLEADLRQAEESLAALEQASEDSMWIDDINEFRKAYEKEYGMKQLTSPSNFPAATGAEWKEAQRIFDRGRRGRDRTSSTSQEVKAKKMTKTPVELQKMTKTQLQLVARESGLGVAASLSKVKLIERLLGEADLSYTGKFTVDDFRSHLAVRGLPTMGLKQELQERLQKWVKTRGQTA